MNNNSILYFLPALYFNEEEFFITKGFLEKNGYKSFIASDARNMCEGTNGKKFQADLRLENIRANNFAGVILIGGKGAKEYWNNTKLHKIINEFNTNKKIIGAICIAPVILANAGLLYGKRATCFYEVKQDLSQPFINYMEWPVVVDKNIITANGPKSSFEFAESILYMLNKQSR
ncbi:MAG: DJ-1/PfpI family protein [Ignavibacteriaceae bacterium]|nr:DJ-1/PfpI family protein [Ignavibacteriaceae bacterium]